MRQQCWAEACKGFCDLPPVTHPVGLPSLKGELAKSALATGCNARPIRNFSIMSASLS